MQKVKIYFIIFILSQVCFNFLLCFFVSGSRKDSVPQVLLLEEESLIIDDMRSNGQTAPEEK